MKNITLTLIGFSVFLLLTSCAVNWKTPEGFAEIKRDSEELLVLHAEGLMMKARQQENVLPGGSQPSLDFWSGNMERSLRERGYHPVDSKLEKQVDSNQALWWSSWILQENAESKRYMVGFKTSEDKLMIIEASAVDSTFLKHQDVILTFFRDTKFE